MTKSGMPPKKSAQEHKKFLTKLHQVRDSKKVNESADGIVDFDKVFPVVQEWLGDLLGQDDLESAAQSIAIALTRNASDIFSTVRRSLMPYIRNVVAFEEIEGIVPSIEDAINGITEARVGKTKEIKVLQGNYGYGWDDLIEYDISDFNGDILAMNKEITNDLRDYRENEKDAPHRVITRRVPVESLKEDWSWEGDKVKIADEMENAFASIDGIYPNRKSSNTVTRDEFDEQFALACRKVLGIDNIWEYQETPIKIDGKEEDIFDIETDIRTILSMSGWETVFEGENEGGLQKLTEALNEGAGAGYTVKGELYDIKVNHIENMDIYKAKSAFDVELDFAKVKVDADARFSGTVAGYYDGVELEDAIVKVTELEINPNILRNLGLEEFNYGEITADDLNSQFGSVIKFESDVIGGGWSHVTFDGNVKASKVDDDYTPFVDGITFHFVNQEDIDYADRGLQGISDEDEFNESLDSELADTFGYTYGISKSEARKRVAGLSKEEKQKKLDLLKNGIKRNAKADFYETQPSKLTEGAKSFLRTLGRDDIQYFTHKNRFNYDLKQIRIDNKNKTYEYGNFAWTNRQESTQNGKEFERLVDKLKEMGYTEVKKSLKERLAKRK
jgi:hypothetical protein